MDEEQSRFQRYEHEKMQSLETMVPKEMTTQTLKALSLQVVVTEIWCNSEIPGALTRLAAKHAKLRSIFSSEYVANRKKEDEEPYSKAIHPVTEKIMALQLLPHKLKARIALNFISLEKDIMDFVYNLTQVIYFQATPENTYYCISKIVISHDCRVDRCATIVKILSDSYLEVDVICNETTKLCAFQPSMLQDVLFNLNVVSNKNEINKKLYKMTRILSQNDVFRIWNEEASEARDANYEIPVNKVQTLQYVAANAPLDVFKYFCSRLKKKYQQKYLPIGMVFALFSEKDNEDKIIFLYQKLSNVMWLKIMVRFHEKLFKKIFLSCHSHYCIEFFNHMCKNNQLNVCSTILNNSLNLLCTCEYKSIVYSNSKDTFLHMWYNTPDTVKLKKGKNFYEMLDVLIKNHHFHLLSMLINDKAFVEKQKFDHMVHIVSRLVMEYNDVILNDYIQESPKDLTDIKKNINIDILKRMILKKSDILNQYEALSIFFNTESILKSLKSQLRDDQTFVIEALSTLAQRERGEQNVKNFLIWICDNDETKMKNFILEKLVTDLWLVDIYKRYLLETSNEYCYPSPFLFTCLNVEPETVDKIKALVRNDTKLIMKVCDNFTSRQLCKVYKLFECIFNENQKEERHKLQEAYWLSKRGLKKMYELFESDFFHEDFYLRHGFYNTVRHYFKIQKHWIEHCPELERRIRKRLNKHGHPNLMKSINDFDRKVPLLPTEKVKINRVIVDANYRMFRSILRDYYCEYDILDQIEQGFSKSLTEYTQHYATRYCTKVHFVP